jgi:hypothetical protein
VAPKAKKIVKRVSFVFMQKLAAAVSLLALLVITIAGIMGGSRIITISYRAALVVVVVGILTRIIIKILENYEEMNSGKG